MTKAKKRLLTLLLAMVMAVGMAVPTFAADYTNGLAGKEYFYQSYGGQTGCGYLNAYPINGNPVQKGTPLRIWTRTSSSDQRFKGYTSSGGYLTLRVQTAPPNGSKYTLMINRDKDTGNAILWSGSTAYFDSNLMCTGSYASGYRFRLANYDGQYLNATGGGNSAIINFTTGVGSSTSSLWKAR